MGAELLRSSQNTTNIARPNIRRIPDVIDIIVSMKDPTYDIYNLPTYPQVYDVSELTPVNNYRSPYEALILTLDYLGSHEDL